MKYLSLCSGIEAATLAWEKLGLEPWAFSEIEAFPSAVLKYRFSKVPNFGDMTKFQEWPYERIDLVVGGTPCQSFSIAGLRRGLDDPRGNLMLTFGAIVKKYRPRWFVWENVPGVLSSNEGQDFASFLGLLTGQKIEPPATGWENSGIVRGIQSAYSLCWRVLDAQYYGVAQRRRRVFVVGYLGDWRHSAAVLFEHEGLRWNPPPSRETGKGFTADVAPSLVASGRGVKSIGESRGQDPVVSVFQSKASASRSMNPGKIAPTLDGNSKGISVLMDQGGGVMNIEDDICGTLRRETHGHEPIVCGPITSGYGKQSMGAPEVDANLYIPVCFAQNSRDEVREMEISGALSSQPGMKQTSYIRNSMQVRRLTPRECERLQGFPDDWTLIPWKGKPAAECPDGPRYKAIGNSMAVPVMRWIGRRIQMVDDFFRSRQ